MKETNLIKRENTVFGKIKNFFKNLFYRKKETHEVEEIIDTNKSSFKENIVIKEDTEKTRLLKLQENFSKGNIDEEDINEEDVGKLYELYDEQIEAINKQTELYKKRILEIKAKLRVG